MLFIVIFISLYPFPHPSLSVDFRKGIISKGSQKPHHFMPLLTRKNHRGVNPIATANHRIWEIDFLRGIAILCMVIFHTVVDLADFYHYPFYYLSGFWYLEGKFSAILFMLLAGVSSTLNQRNLSHGLKILFWGMVLTLVTYVYDASTYIRFGILHFLGVCLLSAPILKRLSPIPLLFFSLISLLLGQVIASRYVASPFLLPLGFITRDFISMDYYPLFPWCSIFIFGILLGKTMYKEKKSCFPFSCHTPFSFLGRYSLLVYLIHQPFLLAVLYLLHHII